MNGFFEVLGLAGDSMVYSTKDLGLMSMFSNEYSYFELNSLGSVRLSQFLFSLFLLFHLEHYFFD